MLLGALLLLAGNTVALGSCKADWKITEGPMASRYELKFDLTCNGNGAAGGAPAVGYSAWFAADQQVFQDAGGTVPAAATDDPVNNWASQGGSYGALACTVPGGFGAPHLKTGVDGIGGRPVVRSAAAAFELLRDATQSLTIFEGGILNVGEGTVLAVVRKAAGTGWLWGDHGGYTGDLVAAGPVGQAYVWDTAARTASQAFTYGAAQILTWHHAGGLLYSGVNDTRTASMASVAAGNLDAAAGFFVLLGGPGPAQYLDGDLAEVVFYPTALDENHRKITESYLAAKYGIALPY